jgi:hypothetical protein
MLVLTKCVIQFAMYGKNTKVIDLRHEIWNSHSGAALYQNLLQCYSVPTGKTTTMFRRIAAPSSYGSRSPIIYRHHFPKDLNPGLRVCYYNSLIYWRPLPKTRSSVSVSKCTFITLPQIRVPCSLLLSSCTNLLYQQMSNANQHLDDECISN